MEFGHLRNFLRQHVVANIRKFSVHLQSFPLSWTFLGLNPENQNTAYNIEGSAIIIIEHQLIYKWQLYIHLKRKLAKADEEEKELESGNRRYTKSFLCFQTGNKSLGERGLRFFS